MTAAKKFTYGLTLAVFAASWIAPLWPVEQALHSSLTVVGLLWLWRHDHRWPMRDTHFIAICAFMVAHCIAARWLYSNIPYDAWLQSLIGWSPNDALGLKRNHADRVIHLLFGLCFAPAAREYFLQRWPALTPRHAFVLAVAAIMCVSLLYEWLEWAIALTLDPEAAEAYNGQQGDMWDAHMDMFLATAGALLAWPPNKATESVPVAV